MDGGRILAVMDALPPCGSDAAAVLAPQLATPVAIPPDALPKMPVSRRLTWTVCASVTFGMVAIFAAYTAAPLVAVELTGGRTWSGLPGAVTIVGTAGGAAVLAELMVRHGRRLGLAAGWTMGALGALLTVAATMTRSFTFLLAAMLVLGVGHGANQLARYAAADVHPPERRGRVLSLVVWVGTVGAVVGPSLLDPMGTLATAGGLARLTGGFLVAVAAFAIAGLVALVRLHPDPSTLAGEVTVPTPAEGGPHRWETRTVVAIAALVAAQFVMVLIMTITPVHVRGHGHGLAAVGVVMSAHVLGMFGLAPVAGWVGDRIGHFATALTGLLVVAAAGSVAAMSPSASVGLLAVALFLLGLGWSAAFVAGSALLAQSGPAVQGRADALAWGFAAVASLGSGILLDGAGYTAVCVAGLAIALAAAAAVLRAFRATPTTAAT